MSFPHSVENFWRRKGISSLLDYLGVPFGHNILTDQKPAEITNKTIDGNKNTLLNIGGGGGGSDNVGILKVNNVAVNAVARALNLSSNFTGADNNPNVDVDIKDATSSQKGIVRLADNNESAAGKAAVSNDTRMSNARTPLAHTHVKADVTDFAHTHVKADITDFAHSHAAGDLPDASTSAKGIVQLANNNESTAGEVVQSNDDRMSNARTPLAHTHAEADITDLSIETAKIENDAVTYAKMQNVSAASKLLGRGDSGSGDPQEITLGTNLSMSGTTLNATGGSGSADDAGIVRVNDTDINTVDRKINFSNDFVGTEDSANDEVEIDIKDGSTSQKGIVQIATDGESNANEVCRSDDTRLSNARTPTAHTHVEADITDLSIETAKIEDDAVTNVKLANMAANTVKARDAGTTGDPADVSIPANTVLGRKGSNIVAEKIDTAQVNDDQITFPKIQNIATDKLLGRDTAASGDIEEITLDDTLEFDGSGNVRRAALTGDVTASAGENATTIGNDAVSNAKAANMAGFSVKAKPTTGSGDPTDLAMGADSVLIRKSGDIVAEKIDTAQINDDQVTFAKVQNIATDKILGRDTTASGNIEELTLDDTLELDGSGNIRRAALTGDVTAPTGDNVTTIAADAVTNAKLANAAANSVKGNATASSDNPTDIAIGADTVLGRKGSNIVAEKIDTAQINDDQVTYAKIQNVVNDDRFLGRISGANGNIEEISPTDATALLNIFTDVLKGLVPASGGGVSNFLRADGTFAAPPSGGTVDTLPEDINLSGIISPSQITANQNDYNPTSWNVSWCMRLNSDASRDITGLTKTTTGRLALLINEGTQNIVLKNDNAGSSATNRFKFGYGQDVTLRPEKCILLHHDPTDDRWRMIGGNVNIREQTVATWDTSSTKTNIGTSYVDIYTATGSEGKPYWIDFTGYTHYRVVLYWNKIGAGTQQVKFCDVANPTTNILHNFSNAVSNENDSGITALPSFANAGGRFEIKIMALSSTSTDDPVFESARIYLI